MAASSILTPEEQTAYEKARYEYCLQIFNREKERKENLEKKSQFYLSLVALFLGAIFFKPEFLDLLGSYLSDRAIAVSGKIGLVFSLVVLAVSLFVTLFAILRAMGLQKYTGEFPANLFDSLFDSNSKFIEDKSEGGFYRATAMALAVALENHLEGNRKKAYWVKLSSYSMIAGVFSLAVLLGIVTYISVSQ